MIGTGGAAQIAKTLGEQKRERANQLFSLLIIFTVIIGIVMSAVGLLIMRPVAIMMGQAEICSKKAYYTAAL